jgi:cytochrome c biogenesis protein CcmG, thiol:disulfide interchange protein DsbE
MRTPPRRRLGGSIVVAALIVGVIVVGLVAASRQDPTPPVAIAEGPPVPALSGADPVSGETVRVADFAGRPLVINLWASWCTGCIAEAPDIRRFTEDHPDVGFLGVAVTDTTDGSRRFVERYDWTHPSIFDARGELAAKLNLRGLPTTVFVRADGSIAGEALGEVTYEQLVDATSALRS